MLLRILLHDLGNNITPIVFTGLTAGNTRHGSCQGLALTGPIPQYVAYYKWMNKKVKHWMDGRMYGWLIIKPDWWQDLDTFYKEIVNA